VKRIYIAAETRHNTGMRDEAANRTSRKGLRKRAYHHGDLKAAMVAAALKLIAKYGPRGFSLSQAAKMAGVSVGAPYRHFADKETLFAAVAAEGFIDLCERLRTANEKNYPDPRQRLLAIGIAYVGFAMDRPSHFQVMFDSTIHRRRDPALDSAAGRAYQILVEAVRDASSEPGVRGRETLAAALWALMHGLALFEIDGTFTSMEFRTPSRLLVHDAIELLLPGER
jgi:AcrR family transcriptional regulator